MSSLLPCATPLPCCAAAHAAFPSWMRARAGGEHRRPTHLHAGREQWSECAARRRGGAGNGRLAAITLRRRMLSAGRMGAAMSFGIWRAWLHIYVSGWRVCGCAPRTAGTENTPGLWTLAGDNSKRETGKQATAANIQAAKVRPPAPGCSPCSGCVCWWCLRGALVAHAPCHRQAVSDIIRTTLGPRSMLKMLLDPMGGIGASCLSALSIRMRAKVFAE